MFELFDTHTHLDQEEFHEDREAVLARARQAGVNRILVVGISASSSCQAVALAEQHPEVFAAVGIHPNYAAGAQEGDWEQVLRLVEHPKVVAIGETGLDRHWDFTPFELQVEYFRRHLELARRTGLPVVVHSRECDQEMLEEMGRAMEQGPVRGVMHSFCSPPEVAQQYLQWGLYLGFTGMVTYRRNEWLRRLVAQVPEDRLLVETDSPYLAPVPHRGKRNEPAWVAEVAACVAQARQVSLEHLAQQTTQNALRLFDKALDAQQTS